MSTLQHSPNHPAIRTRIALIAVLAGAAAALLAALVIAGSNGSGSVAEPHPTKAQIERQLESVGGARYGLARPGSSARQTPEEQLQAVAGARYGQPAWIHRAG